MASCVDEKYQLVGSSEVMQRLREKVLRVASHGNTRVLVSGPSGSGKNRIKEISRLSETWTTSDTFPQF